jgi:plastocyanin
MRKLAVLSIVPVAACIALAVPASGASSYRVKMGDNFFKPKTVTVRKNTTVRWKWKTKAPHDVVGRGPSHFTSGSPKNHGNFSVKLRRKGTYRIVCVVHPKMKMTIRVR